MSASRSLGPLVPSDLYLFRPRFSNQWTQGQIIGTRGDRWLVHYIDPKYAPLTSTQWFPKRRRTERI